MDGLKKWVMVITAAAAIATGMMNFNAADKYEVLLLVIAVVGIGGLVLAIVHIAGEMRSAVHECNENLKQCREERRDARENHAECREGLAKTRTAVAVLAELTKRQTGGRRSQLPIDELLMSTLGPTEMKAAREQVDTVVGFTHTFREGYQRADDQDPDNGDAL